MISRYYWRGQPKKVFIEILILVLTCLCSFSPAFFLLYMFCFFPFSPCVCAHVRACVSAPADLCLLPMDEGSCGRYTLRWYFNSHAQACRPFIYSGCEGNDNRFLHVEECEEVCVGGAEGTQTLAHRHPAIYWMYELTLTTGLLCRFWSSKGNAVILARCFSTPGMLVFVLLLHYFFLIKCKDFFFNLLSL